MRMDDRVTVFVLFFHIRIAHAESNKVQATWEKFISFEVCRKRVRTLEYFSIFGAFMLSLKTLGSFCNA